MSPQNETAAGRKAADTKLRPTHSHASSTEEMFPPETFSKRKKHQPRPSEKKNITAPSVKPALAYEHVSADICAAEHDVRVWSDAIGKALKSTDNQRSAALGSVYRVCWALGQDEAAREAFLRANQIRPHGNVRNWASPIVRHLLRDIHEACRSQIAKYAGAIGWALRQKTPPDEFNKFIAELGGYTAAYGKFAEKQPSNGDAEQTARIEQKQFIQDYLGEQPSEEFDAPDQLAGYIDQQIVLVDFVEPRKFRVVKRFDMTDVEIKKFIERQAKKAAKRRDTDSDASQLTVIEGGKRPVDKSSVSAAEGSSHAG